LLEYQIVGCPDPTLGDDSWFRRQGDETATVGCNPPSGSGETWKLRCSAGKWVGEIGLCKSAESDALQVLGTFKFPTGSSVVIIISISLLIGILILTCGLVCLCRRRRRHADRSDVIGSGVAAAVDDENGYNSSRLIFAQKSAGGGGGGGAVQSSVVGRNANAADRNAFRYDRESNEYASIWEWPLPNTPVPGVGSVGSGDQDSGVFTAAEGGGKQHRVGLSSSSQVGGYYCGAPSSSVSGGALEAGCGGARRAAGGPYRAPSIADAEHPYQRPVTPTNMPPSSWSGGKVDDGAGLNVTSYTQSAASGGGLLIGNASRYFERMNSTDSSAVARLRDGDGGGAGAGGGGAGMLRGPGHQLQDAGSCCMQPFVGGSTGGGGLRIG
jgi:hypothetical protein